jgi:flotillin
VDNVCSVSPIIAEARAALEVAKRIEAEKRAELEAPARAHKAKIIVDAEARAEESQIQARGLSEAAYAQMVRTNYTTLTRGRKLKQEDNLPCLERKLKVLR